MRNVLLRLSGLILLACWLSPAAVEAGPLRPGKGPLFTPKIPTSYSPLHYWAPGLYFLRSQHRPVYYHQYAPGPDPVIIVDHPLPAKVPPSEPEVLPPPEKVNGVSGK